jgi:transcriptional regulator with XRE-family HTH domain
VVRRNYPELWRQVCKLVGQPTDTSIDRVHQAYGEVVGRGTIQRIQAGGMPRVASLAKMADYLGVRLDALLSTNELAEPNPPYGDFSEPRSVTDSEWAAIQALRAYPHDQRAAKLAELESEGARWRRVRDELIAEMKTGGKK